MPCETKLVPINRPNSLESWPNAAQRAPFRRPPAAACDRINAAHRLVDQLVTPCFRWLRGPAGPAGPLVSATPWEVEESSIYADDVAGDHHGEQYCPPRPSCGDVDWRELGELWSSEMLAIFLSAGMLPIRVAQESSVSTEPISSRAFWSA